MNDKEPVDLNLDLLRKSTDKASDLSVNAADSADGEGLFPVPTVLIADDSLANQYLLKQFLTGRGMNLYFVDNGQEAISFVQNNLCDLILMDIHMPVMNGYEASEAIRKLTGVAQKIPIIAITASLLPDIENKIYLSGINGYISKPFLPEMLMEKMAEFITFRKTLSLSNNSKSENDLHDRFSYLWSISRNSHENFIQILKVILTDIPNDIVEFRAFLKQNDSQSVLKMAHKLKSSMTYCDENDLSEQAKLIEESTELDLKFAEGFINQVEIQINKHIAYFDGLNLNN